MTRPVELPLPLLPVDASHRHRHRLLVMSHRGPAVAQPSFREIGLASALAPALRDAQGIWLGWSGHEHDDDGRVVLDASEQLVRARFDLPRTARQQSCATFCNHVLWPLFHGFPNRVSYSDGAWDAYVAVNECYAQRAIELVQPGATIWAHNFQLLLAARALRARGHRGRIGMFLHVPFPAADVLETIPWGRALVEGLCAFDLIGFQTHAFATNFLAAASAYKLRSPEVGVFPATIDTQPFRSIGQEAREVAGLRAELGDRRLLLGVDRLDYSKGIPERLAAYERLLDRYAHWRRRVCFLQISMPTHTEVADHALLRERVEGLVGRINGRFGDTDWVPVQYLYRAYNPQVLAQLYRLADVGVVTPLRDGMNLVAKEFVVAQNAERPGVLVLSQYAGAAQTLASALITNPFHPEGLAADLDHALRMPEGERLQRHRMLVTAIEHEGDARTWADRFLARLDPPRLRTVD